MASSRKRAKELKKLKSSAAGVWDGQREVLENAGVVLREAGRQLGNASREQVVPRVRGVVGERVVPVVASTYQAGKTVVGGARNSVVNGVLPGVSASVASALAGLESLDDPRVRSALAQVRRSGGAVGKNANKAYAAASKRATDAYTTLGTRVGLVKPPKKTGLGFGGWTLIVLGVVLVAGVAYAAWQTLRADDELWVLDETDEVDKPE